MSFLSKYSDTPYNIYRCMHVPTGAFIFIRGAVNDPDERGVVRHIQQNLRRPVTSRSPEDRKVVAKFVESNSFDLSASGIDKEWVIQVVKTVP